MASIKHKYCNCLICSSNISTAVVNQVNKIDELFLLRILLKIPQENQLVDTIKNSLNSIQICEHCLTEIKQCKQIYSEICEKVERFWEYQNKILEKFSKHPNSGQIKTDNYNDWGFQCRKFVQGHRKKILQL